MSFITGALRVVGTLTAAALASTGVGIPLALGIGAATTGVGNLGADLIERNQAKAEADRIAAEQKAAADARIEAQRREAERLANETAARLQRELDQAALPERIMTACSSSQLDQVPALLQQLTNEQFTQLGLGPIAQCTTADDQQHMLTMLDAERIRRGIPT
jgi:hypothetical protein